MDFSGSQAFDLALAQDALTAVTGTLTGAKVHLTKENIAIDSETTLAELDAVEADFNTYAAASITWLAPSIADDGEVEVVGQVPEFRPTDALQPNTIYGAYITDSGGTAKYFAGVIEEGPCPMNDTLDSLVLTIRWRPKTRAIGVIVS